MNISKIDETAFFEAARTERIQNKGRNKSELAIKLDEMQAGDCLEVKCDSFEEFVNARSIVASYKGKCRLGTVSYSASKKNLTIVVRRNK